MSENAFSHNFRHRTKRKRTVIEDMLPKETLKVKLRYRTETDLFTRSLAVSGLRLGQVHANSLEGL